MEKRENEESSIAERKCEIVFVFHPKNDDTPETISSRKMLEVWRKQFTIERFGINHENPKMFILSQWQLTSTPNLAYLMYKWTTTIFFIASWTLSVIDITHINDPVVDRAKWLIYLTNWGFTVCTIQSVLNTIMLTVCYLDSQNQSSTTVGDHKVLQLYKVYWIANITATDIAFGITVIYWALIYDEKKMPVDGMNVIVHVFNSIIMFLDLWVVAHPVRIQHFYCPMICGAFYIVFSIIYYLAGGTNKDGASSIYPILNWDTPGTTTLVCVLVTIFLLFLHVFSYGIYKTRKFLHRKCVGVDGKKKTRDSVESGNDNPIAILSYDVV